MKAMLFSFFLALFALPLANAIPNIGPLTIIVQSLQTGGTHTTHFEDGVDCTIYINDLCEVYKMDGHDFFN